MRTACESFQHFTQFEFSPQNKSNPPFTPRQSPLCPLPFCHHCCCGTAVSSRRRWISLPLGGIAFWRLPRHQWYLHRGLCLQVFTDNAAFRLQQIHPTSFGWLKYNEWWPTWVRNVLFCGWRVIITWATLSLQFLPTLSHRLGLIIGDARTAMRYKFRLIFWQTPRLHTCVCACVCCFPACVGYRQNERWEK